MHLFFLCPIAKAVWSFVALWLGTDCIPNSLNQFYMWIARFLP
uniref:Uncharacterized protein n=1 Tax=Arundo donax TaxID=35708 RepID=A0A0A8ZTL9_ARUDO